MRKSYEVEKAECGHIAPIIHIYYDNDGNGTCGVCVIEELKSRINKKNEKIKRLKLKIT